jgi:hypothetical protein
VIAVMIERYVPTTRKREMFARRPPDGWDIWGNEIGCRPTALGGPPPGPHLFGGRMPKGKRRAPDALKIAENAVKCA